MRLVIEEATRAELINKSRTQSKARFARRMSYSISNFRGLDLKELFENDMLVFTTPINDYKCIVSFSGALTAIREAVKNLEFRQVNLQVIARALLRCFDMSHDVRVDCSCPDYIYRFKYHASKNGYQYGDLENRPSDITNPDDNIGATCKHLSRLLSNKQWIRRASTVLTKFIRTYPAKAAHYLWAELPDDLKPKEELDITDNTNTVDVEEEPIRKDGTKDESRDERPDGVQEDES